ncbi:zinc-binding dehydrogenase [Aeromicrobium stalagmiti]|uniref:zinc-binding dehydrogenase n=1 Tax=Aeromicrobium stalagmiti TaxID=2738988 RepID=UPI001569056C|nr:zinc-binding dehydrogenase [Aeromicrobium stalagmiti]NRQ50053.1 zinc-binding dehydrogenase [Aeromicrobium stalagmiti]
MHAIRQHELGGPEVLRHEELDDLEAGEGQVRLAVQAVGVHLVDTFIRRGEFFVLADLPTVPGREVAGVVDAVGAGVDDAWLGRRVVTHLGLTGGGYASQAVAPWTRLHRVPDPMPLDTAVAAIGTGRTAVGVLDHVGLGADDVVVVTAASGGLGAMLVRAGLHAGATVVGLAGGPDKLEVVRALGVDVVVDYRQDGWDDQVRRALGATGATVVLDGVGGRTSLLAYDLLAPGGTLVNYTAADPGDYGDPDRSMASPLGPDWMDGRPGGLRAAEEEALARAADGSRVPLVGSRFALSDAADAHRALEARQTHGKVVLIPDTFL